MIGKDEDGTVHKGFNVGMRVEFRDASGAAAAKDSDDKVVRKAVAPFPFKCKVESDTTLKVIAPLLPFSLRGNDDKIVTKVLKNLGLPDVAKDVDVSRNAYVARNQNKLQSAERHYILQFPDGVKLDGSVLKSNQPKKTKRSKPYDPATLKLRAVDVEATDYSDHIQITDQLPRLIWQVADLNTEKWNEGELEMSSDESENSALAAMKEARRARQRG